MTMWVRVATVLVAFSVGVASGAPTPLSARQAGEPRPVQVVSANPFGLLLEFFNAEYERVVSESSTAGFGGSTISADNERYLNVDVFWRFYPTGTPLDGWAFGTKLGITTVEGGTYLGYGFDANRSWVMGANENFYVGIGFGLKRLIGPDDQLDLAFVPTIRLVNIGIAF